MGVNSRRIKERAAEICDSDDYQEAKDEEFHIQFQDMFMKSVNTDFGSDFVIQDTLTENDVQGFLDSFTFPDEDTWCMDKACGEYDDIGDQRMEEARDREMEREDD